jgi:hypothetical protein
MNTISALRYLVLVGRLYFPIPSMSEEISCVSPENFVGRRCGRDNYWHRSNGGGQTARCASDHRHTSGWRRCDRAPYRRCRPEDQHVGRRWHARRIRADTMDLPAGFALCPVRPDFGGDKAAAWRDLSVMLTAQLLAPLLVTVKPAA